MGIVYPEGTVFVGGFASCASSEQKLNSRLRGNNEPSEGITRMTDQRFGPPERS